MRHLGSPCMFSCLTKAPATSWEDAVARPPKTANYSGVGYVQLGEFLGEAGVGSESDLLK
jgi:hypothetical protein